MAWGAIRAVRWLAACGRVLGESSPGQRQLRRALMGQVEAPRNIRNNRGRMRW